MTLEIDLAVHGRGAFAVDGNGLGRNIFRGRCRFVQAVGFVINFDRVN